MGLSCAKGGASDVADGVERLLREGHGVRRAFVLVSLTTLLLAASLATPTTILPTGWKLEPPTGRMARVGLFPQGMALSPDGTRLAVVDAGVGSPDLRTLATGSLATTHRIGLPDAFGTPVWYDDARVLVAGAGTGALFAIDVDAGTIRRIQLDTKAWLAAIALAPNRHTFAVVDDLGGSVTFGDLRGGATTTLALGAHPTAPIFTRDGRELIVALRGERALAIVDARTHTVSRIAVGLHPDALALSADDASAYVA